MKKLAIVALVIAIAVVFAVTASNYSGDDVFGRSGVRNLQWTLQSNSRIGATVKGDKLEARFELGVTSDGSGGNVSARRLYGV